MTIRFHGLGYVGQLLPKGSETLHLVRVQGRATLLEVPVGWHSIWMPLGGNLHVKSPTITWRLAPRDLLVWHEGAVRNCGQQLAWFLAVCGPPAAWRPYLPASPGPGINFYPTRIRCPREIRRLLVHLARLASRGGAAVRPLEQLVGAFCSAIVDSQDHIRGCLARCSGRTLAAREQTLIRLLRVHHMIENCHDVRLDLSLLSSIANYSPWHLSRTYREVFGESPGEHVARVRLELAMDLVRGSALSVREITEKLGFESQSTFCRSFKKAYGVTTTEVRTC
jgi:AraC-like DNA-binding protein